jgi:8-oxo-dGTP pyrophosphatase MutT (NUDIX family)
MSPYYQRLREAIGSELLLIPAVAAVIHDDGGRLLLQEKHDGSWSLPAGAVEPGETPEEAVAREVAEETGFACTDYSVLRVLGGPEFRHRYANGHEVEYLIVLFRCRISESGSPPTDASETRSLAWFTREDLPGLALPYDMDLLFPEAP